MSGENGEREIEAGGCLWTNLIKYYDFLMFRSENSALGYLTLHVPFESLASRRSSTLFQQSIKASA